MIAEALTCLAGVLEEKTHLVICDDQSSLLEVFALKEGDAFVDAFPLPMGVQEAAAIVAEKLVLKAAWLDVTTAARLGLDQLPEEFWDGVTERDIGEKLRVSYLGRPGRKYLHFYRAVREGGEGGLEDLKKLSLQSGELAQMAQWVRVEGLFDHRSGEAMMAILAQLSS